jgi:hypothetical protein
VRTAAAAALAAAASVALFVLVRPGAGVNQSAMIEPPPGALVPPVKSEKFEVPPSVARSFEENAPQSFTPVAQRGQRATYAPRARAVNASYSAGTRPAALERPARAERPQEIATEFIPLTQGAQYTQSEEGHVVRVELPRSALASFGLPVNFEAASGRVKADVILGEDGTARAIRFVR